MDKKKYAFKQHIVSLKTGIDMSYYECGPDSGEILLLIHGVTDAAITWTQLAPMLSEKKYHCIAIEYRGNGSTDKPACDASGYTADMIAEDIICFMNEMKIDSANIIGHSYGSLIAQIIALKAPEKCRTIILIDTAVDCTENPVLIEVRDGNGKDYNGVDTSSNMPETFLREWAQTTNEDESFRKATLDNVREMPIEAWRNLIHGLISFNNKDHISEITGKVLVIWGTADDIFPIQDQNDVRNGLTSCDVKYIDVEGATHNGFWDSIGMAEHYAEIIDKYIKSA